jgi:hypothetical protein
MAVILLAANVLIGAIGTFAKTATDRRIEALEESNRRIKAAFAAQSHFDDIIINRVRPYLEGIKHP